MTELERRIRTLAFNRGTDLDDATYLVLHEIMRETSPDKVDGLYDRLFSREDQS